MGMSRRSQLTLGLPAKISFSVEGNGVQAVSERGYLLKGYFIHLLFEAETVPWIATEMQVKRGQL